MFARGLFFYSATITDHCSRTGHARPSGRSDNTAKGAGNALPTVFDGNANGRRDFVWKTVGRVFACVPWTPIPYDAQRCRRTAHVRPPPEAPWEERAGWPSIPFSSSYACASGKDKNEKHRPRLGVRRKRGGLTGQGGQRAGHAPVAWASGFTV